jgi:hypothetical protein
LVDERQFRVTVVSLAATIMATIALFLNYYWLFRIKYANVRHEHFLTFYEGSKPCKTVECP